jgi:hypothetical protein
MSPWFDEMFRTRPLHVFGGADAVIGAAGFAILLYLTILWLPGDGPIGNRPDDASLWVLRCKSGQRIGACVGRAVIDENDFVRDAGRRGCILATERRETR